MTIDVQILMFKIWFWMFPKKASECLCLPVYDKCFKLCPRLLLFISYRERAYGYISLWNISGMTKPLFFQLDLWSRDSSFPYSEFNTVGSFFFPKSVTVTVIKCHCTSERVQCIKRKEGRRWKRRLSGSTYIFFAEIWPKSKRKTKWLFQRAHWIFHLSIILNAAVSSISQTFLARS